MAFFSHAGISFYYEEGGIGCPFVFSHGLGGDLNRALELAAGLPGLRVIVYDNRSHGRTTPLVSPARLTFPEMADDMAALLDHLSLPQAFVGGVSMGAGIALCCAFRHRERIKALVLSRPAWLDRPYPPNLAFTGIVADLMKKRGLREALRQLEQTRYYRDLMRDHPESAKTLRDVLVSAAPDALVAAYEGIPASAPLDSLSSLRMLDIPALVLGNHKDPFHPFELAEMWAAGLPRSRFCVLPSKSDDPEGHVLQFRQQVTEFLSAID